MKRGMVLSVAFLILFVFSAGYSNGENLKKDINKATAEELVQVKGIGEKKAGLIVDYIKSKGRIEKMEELLEVKGIGPKILDKIKEQFDVKDSDKGDIYQKGEDSTYRSIEGMGRTGKQNPS